MSPSVANPEQLAPDSSNMTPKNQEVIYAASGRTGSSGAATRCGRCHSTLVRSRT